MQNPDDGKPIHPHLRAHPTYRIWFSDAYFKIYVLDGFVSLIVVVLDFGLTRPLIYVNPLCHIFAAEFPEPTYVLTPYLFLFNYFQFAKIFSISLLSANRFTCVAYPVWHKLNSNFVGDMEILNFQMKAVLFYHITWFWKAYTNRVILISMLLPALFTWHLAISRTTFDYFNGEAILGYVKVVPFVKTTVFKLVVSLAAFIFILVTNIKTFKLTRQLKNKMKGLEHSLTLSTVIITAVFVVYIIIQAILLIFSSEFLVENISFGSFLKKFEFGCNDFYLMSSPIVLLIMNRRLRKTLFQRSPSTAPLTVSESRNSVSKNSDFVPIVVFKSPSGNSVVNF